MKITTNPSEQINKSTKTALNPPRNLEILTTNQNLDNFQKPKMILKKKPHIPQKMDKHKLKLSNLLAEKAKSNSRRDWEFGFWANLLEN